MTDLTKANYTTQYTVDKIVNVIQGSYTSSALVTETHTLSGIGTTIYFFRVPHGFNRPVFCDLLTSTDNATFSDDGVSGGKIAISDSTYVYILDGIGAPSGGTTYYKIICTWIDNYDTTNPTIQPFQSPYKNTQFDSRNNYQKIYLQDVIRFSGGTFGATETATVNHNLGYTPNYKVWFEGLSGKVMPINFGGATNAFNFDDAQNECDSKMDSTKLSLQTSDFSGASFKAWYKIYLDS